MLCCKTTVAFAQHVMQRFEPNLVWLQLKCHITHHLLTYIEYWNSFRFLYLWGEKKAKDLYYNHYNRFLIFKKLFNFKQQLLL